MGISQLEFEQIVRDVEKERSWIVEINGTIVYLTYDTNRNTQRQRFDFNYCGEITGNCVLGAGINPGDVTPHIFANMVGSRVKDFLKNNG
jgi:hypothetical protein